jgi:hypothetical protein
LPKTRRHATHSAQCCKQQLAGVRELEAKSVEVSGRGFRQQIGDGVVWKPYNNVNGRDRDGRGNYGCWLIQVVAGIDERFYLILGANPAIAMLSDVDILTSSNTL